MDIVFVICLLLAVTKQSVSAKKSLVSPCKKLTTRLQEKICNPVLGEVFTQILAADGHNFTQLCRSVDEYVLCMEPYMTQCDVTHSSEYWQRKAVYTSEPYSCQPPQVQVPDDGTPAKKRHTAYYTSDAAASRYLLSVSSMLALFISIISCIL